MIVYYCFSLFTFIFDVKYFDMPIYDSLPLPKKFGQPKKIETPEKFWELAEAYFKHTDDNPWISGELIKSGDLAGTVVTIKKRMPYTWQGLGVYCFKLGYNTRLDEYKSNRKGGYEDYSEVVHAINEIMYTQKFSGATNGDFNANIIARDLGLAERTVSTVNDLTDEIDYDMLSEATLEELAKARIKKES